METENDSPDLQEVEDRFEEELGPTVRLKSGINLNDLKEGEVEFEISEELADGESPEFDRSNVYKYMDQAAMGAEVDDDAGVDGEPFEILSRKMENVTADGGVKKMLLKQGTGGPIPAVATVRLHYNAYLEYSDEPFDSTYLRDRTKDLVLDDVQNSFTAVEGLCVAVRTMRKGEHARFLIRPKYAYGELGAAPRIPGNASILYQVEVLNIFEYGSGEYNTLTARERKEAPFKQILKIAEDERVKGKDFWTQKRYELAFRKYRRAINLLEDARMADDEDEQKQQKTLLSLYLNSALCSLKLCQSRRVIYYCNQARVIDNNNVKCYYLKGKALRQLGEFEQAKSFLLKAKQLKPASKDIAKEFLELERKMQQMKLKDQQLYRRMFGYREEKPPELRATKDDKAIQTIDESFRTQMACLLEDFLLDTEAMEMPFSGNSFTAAELGCVAAIAHEKDLDVVEKGEGAQFHIKVLKKRPSQGTVG